MMPTQKVIVTADYSRMHTDHRTLWTCDHFEIVGLGDDVDVESLAHLDECPSQGIGRVSRQLLLSLRDQLKLGRLYEFTIQIDADRPGSDHFVLNYGAELREKLRHEAGDYDESDD